MKLEFAWHASPAGAEATCTSDEVGPDGVSPLACLLVDDGGVSRSTTLAWLREGIARVDAVLSGESEGRMDWSREAWGATVTAAQTRVYSLYDEECAETISTSTFRRALFEWLKFFESEGDPATVVVDLV